ncbi:MAG: dockerin type I domain-containing protein [Lachnospiraceae bacterium]|nr:dockerin type I domain-containing protein [Lachnospiraceae bacterium]
MNSNGNYNNNNVNNSYGVRPALHLNLSSAALGAAGTKLKNPENVTTTYDGNAHTLANEYKANSKQISWYNKKYYEHENNYVTVTPQGTLINANESGYWVKVEIQQNWIDDVYADVEQKAIKENWNDAEKAEQKERRRPRFTGDPDTTDSAHMESDTVRWFKFIINRKEVTVNKPTYNVNTGVFVAPSFANPNEMPVDPPTLATRFTGTILATGATYDEIDVLPQKRGNYTAQAILVNSATDKTEYAGNYKIKNASEIKCEVQINRSRLTIVAAAETRKAYSGDKLTFALSGYSSDWTQNAELILPSGMTLEGNDTDGWRLAATDAGEYTVTAALKDKAGEWCWNTDNFSEEIIADQTFQVTVTRKTLAVDFTSTSGIFLLQKGADVKFGALPSNAATRDTVTLTLEYVNSDNLNAKISVPSGTLDASALAPGEYQLIATLSDGAATGNKNYSLEGGDARQNFTVSAKNIEINSVNWQYSQNNGLPTPIAGGAGASASSPVAVTYNGSAFVFALNTDNLSAAGVKVDASYGTNGYINSSQTNATTSAVAVSVRLVPAEEGFAFNDPTTEKPLDQQYKDFTIYVTVNKANVDFSNVVWSADELEFNAVNQQVTIVSGFPSFLTPVYGHPSATNVNSYTTRVNGVTVSNQTVAANYNVPTSAQLAADSNLSHDWKIIKKKITVTWSTTQETGTGGNVIFLPTVSDNSAGAIVYSYWNDARDKEMTLDEIFKEYSQTETRQYWVCASLKPANAGGTAFNETNCVLLEGTTDVSDTGSFQPFQTGENKTPVRVGIQQNSVVYNGSAQPVTLEFQGGNLTINDFKVTYKMKDGSAYGMDETKAPTNAGEYKVVIALNNGQTGQYAITGQCEFDYTIEKFTYDISGMKWIDTENNNEEYTEPYIYGLNVHHNLSFVGDDVDGLTVNYSTDTEQYQQGQDAGSYTVEVEFDVRDKLNYNVPDNISITWEILPFTPDLSAVTWNYHTDSPFVFSIVNGTPVKYKAYLTGIPEGMEELIVYGDDTGEYSDAGSHVTTFSINETHANRKNYGELVFGSGLNNRLVWEIKPLTIDKATQRQTETFRAEGFTFEEITNLPEDFAQYFDVQVLDSADEDLAQTEGTWKFSDVDRYRVLIQFKQGMNKNSGGTTDNVKWSDNARGAYQITFTIEKLVFAVSGWVDGDENSRAELDAEADVVTEIEKYFDYVIKLKDSDEDLGANAVLAYETVYTIALKLKEEYSGNVAVTYMGNEVETTTPYAFQTGPDPLADPPENFYKKPTATELRVEYRYTGKEIAFKLGSWFVSSVMEIKSGDMSATDEGEYQVLVGFRKGSLSAWGDENNPDVSAVTVTFVISSTAKAADKFVLTEAAASSHPFKFQYGDFSEENAPEEYEYDADKLLYITRLTVEDTLSNLLACFDNAEDIKVYDATGAAITDMTKALATGYTLRIMDGDTIVNMLTLSVWGDNTGDGRVNTLDMARTNAHMGGTQKLTPEQILASDVTGDGKVNTLDMARVNAHMAGRVNIFEGYVIGSGARNAVKSVNVTSTEVERSEIDFSTPLITFATVEMTEADINTVEMTEETFAYHVISSAVEKSESDEKISRIACGSLEMTDSNVISSETNEVSEVEKSEIGTIPYEMMKRRYALCLNRRDMI